MRQIIQSIQDDDGTVEIDQKESQEIQIEPEINIRDDDFRLLESNDGRLFIKTSQMHDDAYAEIVPTSEGPVAQIRVKPEVDLTECEPAEREETPDVDTGMNSTVVVD